MKLVFLALMLLPGAIVAQQPFAYLLRGQLGPVPATARLYLRHNGQVLDSARVHKGRFLFRGTSPRPQHVQLVYTPDGVRPVGSPSATRRFDEFRDLFLEPTPIVLTSPGLLRQATVRAGAVNQDYQLFLAQWQAQQDELHGKWRIGDGVRINTLASEQRDRPFIHDVITRFIQQHPTSWVSLDLLEQRWLGPAQYDQVAPLYAALSPTLRQSAAGRAYGQLVDSLRPVALGALAPDLTLRTLTGQRVSVQDYHGQHLLVVFWSSQCECRFELGPTLEVYRRYANRPVAVLTVSLDDQAHYAQWRRALTHYQLPGTATSDLEGPTGTAAQRYRIDRLPQNFLLDPTGRILAVNLYGEELAAALAKYVPAERTKPKVNYN
jgi:peroxiredoxin